MPQDHDEENRKLGINLQIELLQKALFANEKSWVACGFSAIANPVAEGIRRDITEKQAMLSE